MAIAPSRRNAAAALRREPKALERTGLFRSDDGRRLRCRSRRPNRVAGANNAPSTTSGQPSAATHAPIPAGMIQNDGPWPPPSAKEPAIPTSIATVAATSTATQGNRSFAPLSQRWEGRGVDEEPDGTRGAWGALNESPLLEREHHAMDRRRGDLEEALHVRFGGRLAVELRVGVDEGQVLALLFGE